ncbi:sulfite exporter TauE/SafE family protein [Gilvimarinus sp. 1_MG-2023]|uniref:sulfite exporter TauE/SafE family protein n=1 Tax=Gilvimarinus sp. 1_MG-2023 TaxID=3062638 RepID=UPI0026E4455C|nr:sulfite exporter TauE/SafE family protein [Gilvimarinus sp. 1_MG-2023]MDO6746663.1 sulfite exporter TauE/SafE family protein [Gilvimarinus sp. 1_MG-2023]
MSFFLLYLMVGAFAGLMAGLFGIGGGMVIVPVLIFSFIAIGISPDVLTHIAVATSLASIVFTSISSVWEHHRNKAIIGRIAKHMTLGLVLGTSVGVFFISSIPGPVLQKLIGFFALILSLKMLLNWQLPGQGKEPGAIGLGIAGGVIGFGSSWFGIGGGTFTVPYLTWLRIDMRKAVATSATCGLPIALAATFANIAAGWNHDDLPHWSTGFVYWPAVLGIAITSVPFARVGAKLAHSLDSALLKKLFAVLLFIVGVRFIVF